MNYLRTAFFALLILGFIYALSFFTTKSIPEESKTDRTQDWNSVVAYARENLPQKGRLVVQADGFSYLKIDDGYIHALFPMLGLKEEGYNEPPYFRRKNSPGAHISVFYADEHVRPKEAGEIFHFKPKDIVIVRTSKNTSYAVLQVESPELENLRKKYGLKPKLHGHEFHISLAKKTIRYKK